MRLAPVPLFFHRDPVQAVEFSGISGVITHGDRKAYDACRYYGALIVAALRGETKKKLLDNKFYSKHEQWFNNKPLTREIKKIAEGSYKRNKGYDDGIRGKGYIVNALEAALWALWSDGDSFETGALNAVNLGDDTDTTAAIYGQLAGALYGFKNLPDKWVEHLYAFDFISCLSKWITYEGQRWQSDDTSSPTTKSLPDIVVTSPPKSELVAHSTPKQEPKLAPSSQQLLETTLSSTTDKRFCEKKDSTKENTVAALPKLSVRPSSAKETSQNSAKQLGLDSFPHAISTNTASNKKSQLKSTNPK
ncbi:unnamed protein product [Rotaria sp. Silwood1]|nr:unnamed protein product [Rotaria sp. Silwood1]